ncbi:MAG: hypothetical protein M1489_06035 [Firmicutes bacterium]|nr:hypothetical protein [Bacillota bacterium]
MLIAEFEKAKAEVPHYGERGAEAEQVLIKWLNNHLPKRFSACSGFIMDDNDDISPQTDVIIYDALNCPTLRFSERAAIIPADNAAVAIEVKSKLTKEELIDASKKMAAIKSLGKLPLSDLDLLPKGAEKIVQRQTMCIAFAFECSANLRTVAEWYADILKEPNMNGRHIDFISVLNKGWLDLITRLPDKEGFGSIISPEPIFQPYTVPGSIELWVGCHEFPERTLLSMLRLITAHLQAFRTKMYFPYKGIYDNTERKEIFAVCVGALPKAQKGSKPPGRVSLIKKVKFDKNKRSNKRRR